MDKSTLQLLLESEIGQVSDTEFAEAEEILSEDLLGNRIEDATTEYMVMVLRVAIMVIRRYGICSR